MKTRNRLGRRAARGLKRPPLRRMKRILALLQEGAYPNCSTIAQVLEVSVRTAARDLDMMRDSLRLPIEYDDKRHGFYLTRPVSGIPVVPVSAQELFSVYVAHEAIQHLPGHAAGETDGSGVQAVCRATR